MIKKRPFSVTDILDEPIFFEFVTKEKGPLVRNKERSLVTLRDLLKDYENLKGAYETLLKEHQALQEKYHRFEKNIGKGRAKGTYKLNSEQIQEVLKLYRDGISKRQIALKFKVDEKTIRNLINKFN